MVDISLPFYQEISCSGWSIFGYQNPVLLVNFMLSKPLLEKLEQQGYFRLPVKHVFSRKALVKPIITERTQPESEIVGSLSDVGLVNLRIAADREERGLWNEFISRYHYLGYKQPFGYPLRYFIESERAKLGCMLFSGAAKSIGIRDRWIGWNDGDRLRKLAWVVNNTRFLIFPWVKVKNLASHVLVPCIINSVPNFGNLSF